MKEVSVEINPSLYEDYIKARDFAAEARKQAEELADEIRKAAGEDEEITVNGRKVMTYAHVRKFASARFLKDHPELAEQFSLERTETVVDEARLRRMLPELYRKYQVRQLALADG